MSGESCGVIKRRPLLRWGKYFWYCFFFWVALYIGSQCYNSFLFTEIKKTLAHEVLTLPENVDQIRLILRKVALLFPNMISWLLTATVLYLRCGSVLYLHTTISFTILKQHLVDKTRVSLIYATLTRMWSLHYIVQTWKKMKENDVHFFISVWYRGYLKGKGNWKLWFWDFKKNAQTMGKRYYCDYCERSFQDNMHNRKKHLFGVQHQRAKKAWFDHFRGKLNQ